MRAPPAHLDAAEWSSLNASVEDHLDHERLLCARLGLQMREEHSIYPMLHPLAASTKWLARPHAVHSPHPCTFSRSKTAKLSDSAPCVPQVAR